MICFCMYTLLIFQFLFFSLSLGESIAVNNAYRQREGELSVGGSGGQEDAVALVKSFTLSAAAAPSSPSRQNIDSLIEKLQSGSIQV